MTLALGLMSVGPVLIGGCLPFRVLRNGAEGIVLFAEEGLLGGSEVVTEGRGENVELNQIYSNSNRTQVATPLNNKL